MTSKNIVTPEILAQYQQQRQQEAQQQFDSGQGAIGDVVDATQQGAYEGVAAIGDFVGADSLRDWAQQGASDQNWSISQTGREAAQKQFFTEAEGSPLGVDAGDAWTDPRAIAMQIGRVIGMNADIIGGGALVKAGRFAVTNLAKAARTRVLAKGGTEEMASIAAESATKSWMAQQAAKISPQAKEIAGSTFDYGSVGHMVSAGAMGIDIGNEIEAQDFEALAELPEYQSKVMELRERYPGMDAVETLSRARTSLAEDAKTALKVNPTLLTANMLVGGLGTVALERILRGAMPAGSGIATEFAVEGTQGAMEQVAANQVAQTYVDPNRQAMDGVLVAGLNEAAVGGMVGGVAATVPTIYGKGAEYAKSLGQKQPEGTPAAATEQAATIPAQAVTEAVAVESALVVEPVAPVITDRFRELVLVSPAMEGINPMTYKSADMALDGLEKKARSGEFEITDFMRSDVARRLDTQTITELTKSLKDDPVTALRAARASLKASARKKPAKTAATPTQTSEIAQAPEVAAPPLEQGNTNAIQQEASAPELSTLPEQPAESQQGSDWMAQNHETWRKLADSRGLTESIEDLFAQEQTARQVVTKLTNEGKLDFLDKDEREGFIVSVRASLGIPSRLTEEGKQEFAEWKLKRQAKRDEKAVATSAATPQDTIEAPELPVEETPEAPPESNTNAIQAPQDMPSGAAPLPPAEVAPNNGMFSDAELAEMADIEEKANQAMQGTAPAKNAIGDVHIEDYSDKSIVLRGNTKPMADHLKKMGGKFNPKLKGGDGWIFSNKHKPALEKLIPQWQQKHQAKQENDVLSSASDDQKPVLFEQAKRRADELAERAKATDTAMSERITNVLPLEMESGFDAGKVKETLDTFEKQIALNEKRIAIKEPIKEPAKDKEPMQAPAEDMVDVVQDGMTISVPASTAKLLKAAAEALEKIPFGTVGKQPVSGESVRTSTGRNTSKFPFTSAAKTKWDQIEAAHWYIGEAHREAKARKDHAQAAKFKAAFDAMEKKGFMGKSYDLPEPSILQAADQYLFERNDVAQGNTNAIQKDVAAKENKEPSKPEISDKPESKDDGGWTKDQTTVAKIKPIQLDASQQAEQMQGGKGLAGELDRRVLEFAEKRRESPSTPRQDNRKSADAGQGVTVDDYINDKGDYVLNVTTPTGYVASYYIDKTGRVTADLEAPFSEFDKAFKEVAAALDNDVLSRVHDGIAEPVSSNEGKQAPSEMEPSQPEPSQPEPSLFASNKLITADAVAAARARIKEKLSPGRMNSNIDPTLLADGMIIAAAYIEAGVRKFSDYSKAMVGDFGDGIKPFLLSFWEGARHYPGLDTQDMTSAEESAREYAALNAEKEPVAAALIGSEVAKPTKRHKKNGSKADAVLTQDWGVDHIDGYGDNYEREIGNSTKDAFMKDAAAYLGAVADLLIAEGFTPRADAKGKTMRPVSKNEGGIAVSGDVTMTLQHETSGANVYAHVGDSSLRGVVPTTTSGIAVMYRVSFEKGDTFGAKGQNRWAPTDLAAGDLAKLIMQEANGKAPVLAREPITIDVEPSTTEEQRNDQQRNDPDNARPLENEPSSNSESVARSTATSASRGRGETDENGNGQPTVDRSKRTTSVDGSKKPVLPNEATPPANGPVNRTTDRPHKLSGENPGNFVITDELGLGDGTASQKVAANLAAIRVVKALDKEQRFATKDEQAVLAKYVGWGGLKSVFDIKKAEATDFYGKAQRELKELLSPAEYDAANRSIQDAHYTPQGVVDGMWFGARHFGFKGGRVLEPTVGVGNFIGRQPADMAASTQWFAAELDKITGAIAKHLYPEATVMAGTPFQEAPFADGVFDLVIGNPPFGAFTISDKSKARKHLDGLKIHNYIIAKAAMHLRPGAIMQFVVTSRFLDTANPEARDVLAKDFNFVGAIRLPNDAFKQNAGTEVVTDIIVLQKRRPGDSAGSDAWLDTNGSVNVDGQAIKLNRYFAENPSHILGRLSMDGKMYAGSRGGNELTVHSDGRDLKAAIEGVYQNGMKDYKDSIEPSASDLDAAAVLLTQSDLPIGGMMLDADGKIYRREMDDDAGNAVVVQITPETIWKAEGEKWTALADAIKTYMDSGANRYVVKDAARFLYTAKGDKVTKPTKLEAAIYDMVDTLYSREPSELEGVYNQVKEQKDRQLLGVKGYAKLKALMSLRNRTISLIHAERNDAKNLDELRAALNVEYRDFVKNQGYVSAPDNIRVLQGDIGVEVGLEAKYTAPDKDKGTEASVVLAELLRTRIYHPVKEIESAKDAQEAVSISLSEKGRIDLAYMASLLKRSTQDLIQELSTGDDPVIFYNPESEQYEHAEIYLSGNVKDKLKKARQEQLVANVKALEGVQPAPLPKSRIVPTIRSAWIPQPIYQEFLEALGAVRPKVSVIPMIGKISAAIHGFQPTDMGAAFVHQKVTFDQIFNSAASGKALIVSYKDQEGRSHTDQKATKEGQALAEKMAETFSEWVYSEDERAQQVVDAYNEKMNTHQPRKYYGVKYLKMVGANPAIQLRNTQKNGAWRMIQDSATLLDHVVGAGKTYTAIAGVMERKRLGLSKKPMVVVPNHLVVQWAKDFLNLYPAARILAATPDDFTKSNRRRLFARIATGSYDAIIIGHSSLSFIENPVVDEQNIILERRAQLREALEIARTNGESKRSQSQIQARIDGYEKKLSDLMKAKKADDMGVDFAAMGIDYLVVDEAHEFKNLEYSTAGERVGGMNDPKGSAKAFNLYVKVRGLQSRKGGVTFATGTPVSNSLVELYTMMSYLATDELNKREQAHFDSWSGAYARTETRLEYTSNQKLKPRRVLAGLANLDALGQLYRQFADIISMTDLKAAYTEEKIEANKNKPKDKQERTSFPVPKVAGGGRRLDRGGITAQQQEYMDYLVARSQAIEANAKDKEYIKIDNPLWVMTDARKMSLDIRIVDPAAPRDENGKVARAAAQIKQIYDKWHDDRGTQLVFCDQSTPAKTAVNEAKGMIKSLAETVHGKTSSKARLSALAQSSYADQWRALMDDLEAVIDNEATSDAERDRLNEYVAGIEDANAVMITADVGFSVYDDLKAVLVEKGVPPEEIAFIHDYNTPEQKSKLFEKVKAGDIRVLLGSSAKMGAGTNVQDRVVALHHLDAPWRPSDVEQREGRVIRQGNIFYQRDPDGFEVEIVAYSTDGTSDTVMWQILERKSSAIEQFRSAGLDTVEEESSDSDQYAEFMATSTGNPVFRLKLEAERALEKLMADVRGRQISKSNAEKFLKTYENQKASAEQAIAILASHKANVIALAGVESNTDEYQQVIEAERLKYESDYAAWTEEVARIKAIADAMPPDAKDKPKTPAAPPRPNMFSEAVRKQSAYAQMVRSAIDTLKRPDRKNIVFQFGDIKITVSKTEASSDEQTYSVNYAVGDVLERRIFTETLKRPELSTGLMTALTPKYINEELKAIDLSQKARLKDLAAKHPQQKKLADADIDMRSAEAKAKEVEWFKMEVALAEVSADIKRSSRANRYIARDEKRALQPVDASYADEAYIERDNASYLTTGVVAKKSWNTKIFEALETMTKERVIIERDEDASKDVLDNPEQWSVVIHKQPDSIVPFDIPQMVGRRTDARIPRRRDQEKVGINKMRALAAAFDLRLKNPGGGTVVVENVAELSKHLEPQVLKNIGPDTTGFLVAHTKTVYVIADRTQSLQDLQELLVHEHLRHRGVRAMFGDAFWSKMTKIGFAIGTNRLKALAEKYGMDVAAYEAAHKNHPHPTAAFLDEVIAHIKQSDVPTGIWQNIKEALAMFRAKLREWKLFEWLDAFGGHEHEIMRVLKMAENHLNGRGPQGPQGPQGPAQDTSFDVPNALPPLARKITEAANAINKERLVRFAELFKPSQITQAIKTTWPDLRPKMLQLLPRNYLSDIAGGLLPSLRRYNAQVAMMEAERNDMLSESHALAKRWYSALAKNKDAGAAMAELMHQSTLHGVNPTTEKFVPTITPQLYERLMKKTADWIKSRSADPEAIGRGLSRRKRIQEAMDRVADQEVAWKELRARYLALPSDFKTLFSDAAESYQATNQTRVEAVIQRIKDLVQDDRVSAAQVEMMRDEFEVAKLSGMYFPLFRSGKYKAAATDKTTGEMVAYSMFETNAELKAWTKEQEALGLVVNGGYQLSYSRAVEGVSAGFVKDLMQRLGPVFSRDNKLQDDVYQLFLEHMPQLSMRKHMIHRKGVAGFSEDALKAFATNQFHAAYQIAKIKHTHHMAAHMLAMESEAKDIKDLDDSVKAGQVADEMRQRNEYILNPRGSETANRLTGFGFWWYLGTSPAAALVNVTQTAMVALPIVGARYGYKKTAKAMSELSRDFMANKGAIEQVLNPRELAAHGALIKSGIIDKTMTHDLLGIADGGAGYSPTYNKVMQVAGWMFHKAELFNREVTSMAAYRLAYNKFRASMTEDKAHDAAVNMAIELTRLSHFDYANSNRPRFMQGDMARVLLLFRQHSINMTYRLVRDFQQSFWGKGKERDIARRQFAGMMGMTFLFAGAAGLPLYSVVAGIFNTLLSDDDDPFDFDKAVRDTLAEAVGEAAASVIMNGAPGTALQVDLTNRIGLNNLWLRDSHAELDGEGAVQYYAEQALGPIYGIVSGWGRALDLAREGHTGRAWEAAVPKFARDWFKAVRFADEGALSLRGDPIVEEFNWWEIAMQASGFTPLELSEQYRDNSAVKGMEQHILNRRKLLLNRYALGKKTGDTALVGDTLQAIDVFNDAQPSVKITPADRVKSLKLRQKQSERAKNGIIVSDKLSNLAQ